MFENEKNKKKTFCSLLILYLKLYALHSKTF